MRPRSPSAWTAAPSVQRPVAAVAVLFITTVNYFGITKTAALNRALVTLVFAVLTIVVVATLGGGEAGVDRLTSWFPNGVHGILQAAGLLFFVFAGYARIATLGAEVKDPSRTIPRAIPLALGIALALYAVVAVSVLLVLGPEPLAHATAPLYSAVSVGRFEGVSGIVRVGGALAAPGSSCRWSPASAARRMRWLPMATYRDGSRPCILATTSPTAPSSPWARSPS